MEAETLHYPNLKTILAVEKVLQEADEPISKNEIMRRLPKKIMRQTLSVVIDYLEESGKILNGKKGILWTFNENPKFNKLLRDSVEA